MNQEQKLAELLLRLDKLADIAAQQEIEIALLKKEIAVLVSDSLTQKPSSVDEPAYATQEVAFSAATTAAPVPKPAALLSEESVQAKAGRPFQARPAGKDSLESFIGGNLINKIGILVLVIGVGIFVKYAIDSNLLGPTGRITVGYMVGLVLLGLAYRLKSRYIAYSAVLLSGGVATLYFTTYFAYDFYHLLPHIVAFGLMVGVTGFTIYAATVYNQQVIGIIGLVGAYAVPMLLSQHTGKAEVLFTYMAIINIGIAILAFRRKWIGMDIIAFLVTWLIFAFWFAFGNRDEATLQLTLGFGGLFFLIFYAIFLLYSTPPKALEAENRAFIFLNTFIFFWIGLAAIERRIAQPASLSALFSLCLGVVHGSIAAWLYYRKYAASVYYITLGLAVLFLTVAVGIYFDGPTLTLVWALEGVLLCWLGYKLQMGVYVYAAGVVLIGSCLSLFSMWEYAYGSPGITRVGIVFLLNRYFGAALAVVGSLVAYIWLTQKHTHEFSIAKGWKTVSVTGFILLAIVLFYIGVFLEIRYLFTYKIASLSSRLPYSPLIRIWAHQREIGLVIFLVAYVGGLVWLSSKRTHNITWKIAAFWLVSVAIAYWFIVHQTDVEALRDLFLQHSTTGWVAGVRYLVYAVVGGCLWSVYRMVAETFGRKHILRTVLWIEVHFFVLAVLSFELRHVVMLLSPNPWQAGAIVTKAGFSVLWGVYALGLVAAGIRLKARLFRLLGIGLLALTLAKLFMRDLNYISQLSKIIAFIGLGVLLLIISFLYQRFKDVILAEDE